MIRHDISLAAIAAVLGCGAIAPALAQEPFNADGTASTTRPDHILNVGQQVSRTDIVVTAKSREDLRNALSPGAVSIIYPDDTRGEHKAMPDLLDQVPGVFVRRVNGTGQYTTASIRGSAPSQVNIYVDGVPYNTSGEAAADISTIPVSSIERIEVYRGTVPARFSGSPLGGAINIVTKKAVGLSGTVSGGVRSFGSWQTSANINLPLFGGSLLLGADTEGSKGDFDYLYYAFDQVKNTRFGTGADGQPNTPLTIFDVGAGRRIYAGAYYYPSERTRQNNGFDRYNGLVRWANDHFSAKYSYTRLRRTMPQGAGYASAFTSDLPAWTYPNVPADVIAPTADGIVQSSITNPRRRQLQRQHEIALGWQDNFGGLEVSASLNLMDRVQHYDNLDLTGLATLGAYWTHFHTQRFGGQIDLAYLFGKDGPVMQRLELHAQGSQETMWADASASHCDQPVRTNEYYCRFRRQLVNFQAQDSITVHSLGDLLITPVLRVEKLSGPVLGRYRNPVVSGSGDFKWQPTFGVSVKKNFGGWLIFADTGTYNRYPNFYEIYGDGANITPGSGDISDQIQLSREHGRNSDIGIGWNGTIFPNLRASFRTTFFVREAQDEITLLAQGQGSRYVNSGTTVTRGGEFEGNLVFSQFADIQAAISYQKGRYTKGTYYWYGGASARVLAGDDPVYRLGLPNVAADVRLNLHFLDGALTTFGEVRHVGRRYLNQRADVRGVSQYNYEKPLTTFDLGAHYKFGSGIALSLGVNDVFNAGPKQRQYSEMATPANATSLCNQSSSCTNPLLTLSEMNVAYPQQGRTFFATVAKSFGAEDTRRRRMEGTGRARSWTGFYVGASGGRGWAPVKDGERLVFDTARGLNNGGDGVFNDAVKNGGFLIDPVTDEITSATDNAFTQFDGRGVALGATRAGGIRPDRDSRAQYGLRIGYDRQIGNWVIGGVAEWAHYGINDAVTAYGLTNFINPDGATLYEYYAAYYASYAFDRKLNSMASLRLRGGGALGHVLAYGTVGVARADLDETFTTTDTRHQFAVRETKRHPLGLQWGGGIETRVVGPFTIGLEYLQTRLKGGPTVNATGYDDTAAELPGIGFQFFTGAPGTDIKRSSDSFLIRALRVTAGFRF